MRLPIDPSPRHAMHAVRHAMPNASPSPAAAPTLLAFVAGMALGALCMYLTDPVSGRRRRSTSKQSASRLGRINAARPAQKRLKDLSNRAKGLRHKLVGDEASNIDDNKLQRRVRTALGRLSQQPTDIDVQVADGHVELTGRIGRMEQRSVVHGVKQVRGTKAVTNRMEAYDETAPKNATPEHS